MFIQTATILFIEENPLYVNCIYPHTIKSVTVLVSAKEPSRQMISL